MTVASIRKFVIGMSWADCRYEKKKSQNGRMKFFYLLLLLFVDKFSFVRSDKNGLGIGIGENILRIELLVHNAFFLFFCACACACACSCLCLCLCVIMVTHATCVEAAGFVERSVFTFYCWVMRLEEFEIEMTN